MTIKTTPNGTTVYKIADSFYRISELKDSVPYVFKTNKHGHRFGAALTHFCPNVQEVFNLAGIKNPESYGSA